MPTPRTPRPTHIGPAPHACIAKRPRLREASCVTTDIGGAFPDPRRQLCPPTTRSSLNCNGRASSTERTLRKCSPHRGSGVVGERRPGQVDGGAERPDPVSRSARPSRPRASRVKMPSTDALSMHTSATAAMTTMISSLPLRAARTTDITIGAVSQLRRDSHDDEMGRSSGRGALSPSTT